MQVSVTEMSWVFFFKDLWDGIRILTQSYFVFQPSI